MKILVAEDDGVARLILTKRLQKMGHDVIVTEEGGEAWDAFHTGRPQIVITDLEMPKIDGLQLCQKIRAEHQDKYVYIIILTAREGKKAYIEGLDAGADDFMHKPVDMDELAARLRVAARILSMQTEMRQLEGLLPICSYCKKIRDENDSWMPIEGYISTRTEATFSHGACPSCVEKYIRPQMQEIRSRKQHDPSGSPQTL
ncbi:MAG TPA: response regulator transcription factor [Bacteroidota bacterium]|nr:response regulator transcription factor [Bacteroidota bacterium]